ncbi:MAG: glycoside hydrolase family 97 N-terminal domain-containing protein, partial [Pirellulales bacterium]|nr:glycoside hydrolase family 97 N-terminal domain-containing protein [Pirellulales bacterium]
MKSIFKTGTFCVCLFVACSTIARAAKVQSPDGNVVIDFRVKNFDGANGCAVYSISYRGKIVVKESKLGLDMEGGPLGCGLEIVRSQARSSSITWKPVYGERGTVNDNYRELTVELRETAAPHRQLQLTFRAYNEGAAFCYTIPKQAAMQEVKISGEKSEFRFPADYTAWAVYSAQGVYAEVPLSRIKPGCERPLTIRVDDKTYLAVAEARLVDYARM